MVASAMLAATSCSDFSDYNTAPDISFNGGDKTLWQNISANEELSDFATVLQKVGYDKILDESHTYTVWAPVNGSFKLDSVLEVSDDKIIKEFINCHVADYAHQQSDVADTVVYMLNKKLIKFSNKNTADIRFDNQTLKVNPATGQFNQPCLNGILYAVNGQSNFRSNGYEYLDELKDVASSYMKYVKKYEKVEIDYENSVKGQIVDGVQQYDFITTILKNSFVSDKLNYGNRSNEPYLNMEDSVTTLIVYSDKAWDDIYNRMAPLYNYITPINYQDLGSKDVGTTKGGTSGASGTIMKADLGKVSTNLAPAPADAEIQDTKAYWKDSISVSRFMRRLIYSQGYPQNKKLVTGEEVVPGDTLIATDGRYVPLTGNDLLINHGKSVRLSNGNALLFDKYIYATNSYLPTIRVNRPDRVVTTDQVSVNRQYEMLTLTEKATKKLGITFDSETGETELRYVKTTLPVSGTNPSPVNPSNLTTAPEADFYLDNVLSTTYDCYLVVVPAFVDSLAIDPNYEEKPGALHLPYTLRVDINYTNEKNEQITGRFDGEKVITSADLAALRKIPAFEIGSEKVDTFKLGRVTFPICYANTAAKPNIKVMHTVNTFSSTNKKKYTQELRIANIILRPVEEEK